VSPVNSWHCKNKYAQVFATRFGWIRVFQALSLLFQREDGVPPTSMVMDGSSKEQLHGDFCRKCCEANCHVKQTEP
jgi:hypothetical protein